MNNNKNNLLISIINWIDQSDIERDGTFSCGLATLAKDQYHEYCIKALACDKCPFWINQGREELYDVLHEYME